MDNFISVIITVYNRREFYKDAINSVLSQDFPKDKYELIVVSNIDLEIPQDSNIKFIRCGDVKFGEQAAIGVEKSNGNIVCFLDDDDMFLPGKLKYIYEQFSRKPKLGYLHNSFVSNAGYHDDSPIFNNSCISVSKDIIDLDKLKKWGNSGFESFCYLSAIEKGKKVLISKKKLTFYRIQANTSISKDMVQGMLTKTSVNVNMEGRISRAKNNYEFWMWMSKMFKSKNAQKTIRGQLTLDSIKLEIMANIKPEKVYLLDFLTSNLRPPKYRFGIFALYILYKFNKSLAKSLFARRYEGFLKEKYSAR